MAFTSPRSLLFVTFWCESRESLRGEGALSCSPCLPHPTLWVSRGRSTLAWAGARRLCGARRPQARAGPWGAAHGSGDRAGSRRVAHLRGETGAPPRTLGAQGSRGHTARPSFEWPVTREAWMLVTDSPGALDKETHPSGTTRPTRGPHLPPGDLASWPTRAAPRPAGPHPVTAGTHSRVPYERFTVQRQRVCRRIMDALRFMHN